MSALLLYGVARADKTLVLPADGTANGVRLITQGKVAAIAGGALSTQAHGLTRQSALRHLLIQQQMLEAVMAQGVVLPVRFGSVAPDEAAVRRMLAQGEDRLAAKLDEFAGCVQIEVAVTWSLERVFSEIGKETHIVRAGQAPGREANEGVRARLGALVKASLDRRRRDIAERLIEELLTVAADAVENPLSGDDEVASFTLLLDKADVASLEGVLNRLDADFGGRLDFRCIGPAPLSTFAVVDVDFSSALAAQQAWRTGGLADAADFEPLEAPEEQDIFVNVIRREPAFFGPFAPALSREEIWRSEEARP